MSPEVIAGRAPLPAVRPRAVARSLVVALGIALVVLWVVFLRPEALGGPVAYTVVAGKSMLPTMRDGDLVVVLKESRYRPGEVIAYHVPAGDPASGARVIHRIVGGSEKTGYLVQGDNKTQPDPWRPKRRDIIGKEWLRIPRVGAVFVWARSPLALGALAAGLVFALIAVGGSGGRPEEEQEAFKKSRSREGRRG